MAGSLAVPVCTDTAHTRRVPDTEIIRDDFQRADGALGVADSGQTWLFTANTGYRVPSISGDKMVIETGHAGLPQINTPDGNPPLRMSAKWVFEPSGSPVFGAVALVNTFSALWDPSTQNAGMHLSISWQTWTLAYWDTVTTRTLVTGSFNPTLPLDGTTVNSVEATIVGDSILVTLPDGHKTGKSHPMVGANTGQGCVWEPYWPSDPEPRFTEIRATKAA